MEMDCKFMENFSARLLTPARASVKTDLDVSPAKVELQNLFIQIGQCLGRVIKRYLVLY